MNRHIPTFEGRYGECACGRWSFTLPRNVGEALRGLRLGEAHQVHFFDEMAVKPPLGRDELDALMGSGWEPLPNQIAQRERVKRRYLASAAL